MLEMYLCLIYKRGAIYHEQWHTVSQSLVLLIRITVSYFYINLTESALTEIDSNM